MAPNVVRGPDKSAHRFILSGRPGIGKTFLVSTIPGVFFIPIEEGLKGTSPDHDPAHYDVIPKNFAELCQFLDRFVELNKEGEYRHLALDSVTGIERLVHLAACGQERVAHMDAKDFKKVWGAALPTWANLQARLDAIRRKGVHIWLIAHGAEVGETDAESGEQWKRWDLAFSGSGNSLVEVRNMWRAWADHVLFIDWAVDVTKGTIGRRATARYKARILHTRESPTHFAKNRASLPPTLPATWADLERALRTGSAMTEKKMRAMLGELVPTLGEEDRATIAAALAAAKTTSALAAVLSRAEGMASIAAADAATTPPVADGDGVATPAPMGEEPEAGGQATPPAAEPVESPPEKHNEGTLAKLIEVAIEDDLPRVARLIKDTALPEDARGRLRELYKARRGVEVAAGHPLARAVAQDGAA